MVEWHLIPTLPVPLPALLLSFVVLVSQYAISISLGHHVAVGTSTWDERCPTMNSHGVPSAWHIVGTQQVHVEDTAVLYTYRT